MNDLDMVEDYLKKMAALAPYTPRGMSNIALYIEGWVHYLKGNPGMPSLWPKRQWT